MKISGFFKSRFLALMVTEKSREHATSVPYVLKAKPNQTPEWIIITSSNWNIRMLNHCQNFRQASDSRFQEKQVAFSVIFYWTDCIVGRVQCQCKSKETILLYTNRTVKLVTYLWRIYLACFYNLYPHYISVLLFYVQNMLILNMN